jgi:hypothetical protein
LCLQYVNTEVVRLFFFTGSSASLPVMVGGIPVDPAFAGIELKAQAVTVLPPLSVVTSNGLEMVLCAH